VSGRNDFFVAASGFERILSAVPTGVSQGLTPRFEALQNLQVSKDAGGVMAKAITPLARRIDSLKPSG